MARPFPLEIAACPCDPDQTEQESRAAKLVPDLLMNVDVARPGEQKEEQGR